MALLIGPTGSGKSALGNFLLDLKGGKKFRPKTQHVESSPRTGVTVRRVDSSGTIKSITRALTVIDTPALKKGNKEYLEHMIGVVENLKKEVTIRACIFVVNFKEKIDQEYKDIIEYYSKLLPYFFRSNSIIVVMTHCATDEHSEEIRAQKKKEMIDSWGIDPTNIFAIDSRPFCPKKGIENSTKERNAILASIFYQDEIPVDNLRIPKNKAMLLGDELSLNEKIKIYREDLAKDNQQTENALHEIEQIEQRITTIETRILRLEESLKEKDSDDFITGKVWSVNDPFEWFQCQKKAFDIETGWDIMKVNMWTNGHSEWKDYVEGTRRVHGVLHGDFMRGLYAYITLETKIKFMFATEIDKLNTSLREENDKLVEAQKELTRVKAAFTDCQQSIKELEDFIKEKRRERKDPAFTKMTLEQAKDRLMKLNN